MAKKTSSKAKKHSSLQNHNSKLGSSSKQEDMANGSAKVSNKSTCKRKKAFPKLRGSYSLRSLNSGRVLRSRPNTEKSNTPLNPGSNPENLVKRVKKRGKMKVKKVHQDELSRIKKHIRYILNRLNYEQILIDAYSGEGWKGQSAEKIRPEKELGRAKSEILRCKLKIREIFQHLDSLLVEGRLQESLFDPDGIDSENIFCGKCGSKEVSADNDIVLCDGICERGFHQKCLNPPLLSEDIPSGDEGWLCPQCDCKAECIDLLSEFFGKDISIESSWEEIFPEAAALANVNGQHDNLNLSSDDSEDDDYNPDAQAVDVDEQKEGPVGEESDSSSSSDNNVDHATAELSTDDSEDENYDPDALDSDKEIQKTNSSSDESDFTSDSDEFCTELGKNSHAYETPSSSPNLEFFTDSGRDNMNDQDKPLDYSKFPSSILEVEKLESGLKLTNKRERERLDYKKLYEEAYGKSSSDSSDDEDWNEMNSPKKLMKIDNKKVEEVAINNIAKTTQKLQKRISSISASEKELPQGSLSTSCSSSLQKKSSAASKILHDAFQENQYPTKDKKDSLAQELGMTMHQVTKWFGHKRHSFRVGTSRRKVNDAIKATVQEESSKKKLNEAFQENQFASKEKKQGLTQELGMTPQKILYDVFQENQYPDKEKKESLAQELGMTFLQVSKWFGNARHSFRAASMRSMHEDTCKKKLNEAFQENQNPSKEQKQELAQELGMTAQKVARWFENAQFNSRISSNESSNPMASSPDRAEASVIHKLDIAAADKASGDKIATPKSCTSPMKPGEGIELKAPGTPTANGDASNEKEKKAVGTTTPKRGSDNSRDGINEEDDRKKAIAKELRRMRTGR